MKKKINKTLIPFIKHLENKGYTVEKDTDMDNCFGVVGDIFGAFAIVFEKNRITFRTARHLLENMKYNRYEL